MYISCAFSAACSDIVLQVVSEGLFTILCLACEFQRCDSRNRWLNSKSTVALFPHFYSFPFLMIPNTSDVFCAICFFLQLSSCSLFFFKDTSYSTHNSFPIVFSHHNLKSALCPSPALNYFSAYTFGNLKCQKWRVLTC